MRTLFDAVAENIITTFQGTQLIRKKLTCRLQQYVNLRA
jgi:hypothetical protein